MAQRVKDLALSLWCGRFDPWPGNFCMAQVWSYTHTHTHTHRGKKATVKIHLKKYKNMSENGHVSTYAWVILLHSRNYYNLVN